MLLSSILISNSTDLHQAGMLTSYESQCSTVAIPDVVFFFFCQPWFVYMVSHNMPIQIGCIYLFF